MTSTAAALALCRFGQDAAATMLWGTSAYLWALVPAGLAGAVAARLRVWAAAAVAGAVLAVAAKLPVEVAGIGDGWPAALDPAAIRDVLFHTGVGQAWAVQVGCAVLLVAAAAAPHRRRMGAVAAASGLSLASLSLQGHAAMHDGWLGIADRADDVVHVLSGGAWLGSLAPVLVILALSRRGQRCAGFPAPGEAAAALRAFSRAGRVAVALVLLSGVASTALTVGRWPVDLARPYEALLDLKIACVSAMTVLALVNRYVVMPRMARDPAGAGRALRLCTLAEVPLGLAALALVAAFGLLDPG